MAELRQILERSSTEGALLRNLSTRRDQDCERQYCTRSLSSSTSTRSSTIHQRVSTLRNQETELQEQENKHSDPCSCESSSDHKRFDEHWKAGVGKAIAHVKLTSELRWSGTNLPKIETQKIFELRGKQMIPWLGKISGNWTRLNDSYAYKN